MSAVGGESWQEFELNTGSSATNATARKSLSRGIQLHGRCPKQRVKRGKLREQTAGQEPQPVPFVRIVSTSKRAMLVRCPGGIMGIIEIETDRINEIASALREKSWRFVGPIKLNDHMFQCWVQIGLKIYCCTHAKEWDAVDTGRAGLTAGIWDVVMTTLLRAASGE